MSSRRTLSAVERDLLEKITALSDTVVNIEFTRQLREFMLILNSQDHDINDFMSYSMKLLDFLDGTGDQHLSSNDRDELVRRLRAANHLWSTALELKTKSRGKGTKQTTEKVRIL
jgi:hypothetical protein